MARQLESLSTGPRSNRSEEVQAILGRPPGWLMRISGLLLLFVLVVLLGLCFVITYPEVVQSELMLTSVDPPRRLKAREGIYVTDLLVRSEDTVRAGTTLMAFRSSARFEHVQVLGDRLLSVRDAADSLLINLTIPGELMLGRLQEKVYEFQDKQETVRSINKGGLYEFSVDEIRDQINLALSRINSDRIRLSNLTAESILLARNRDRAQSYYESGLADEAEVRVSEETLLANERQRNAVESEIRNKEVEIKLLRRRITNLRNGTEDNSQAAAIELRETYRDLVTEVEEWKRDFLLISPINGVVVLDPNVHEREFIKDESTLATVLPLNPGGNIGRIDLDLVGAGKVSVGQRVLVRFKNYPSLQFGTVEGRIRSIGRIPSENETIPLVVEFPDGLLTSTDRKLEATPFMIGEVDIVVERRRLIEWLFQKF